MVHAGQRVAHACQVTVLPSDINQQLAKVRRVWKKLQKKAEGTVHEGTSKHLMDELMEREDLGRTALGSPWSFCMQLASSMLSRSFLWMQGAP